MGFLFLFVFVCFLFCPSEFLRYMSLVWFRSSNETIKVGDENDEDHCEIIFLPPFISRFSRQSVFKSVCYKEKTTQQQNQSSNIFMCLKDMGILLVCSKSTKLQTKI